jgi:hypothetical protein
VIVCGNDGAWRLLSTFWHIDRIYGFQERVLALSANWSDSATALRFQVFFRLGYQATARDSHERKPGSAAAFRMQAG